MRRFCLRSALFLTPLIVILGTLEFYVRSLPSSYCQKELWMEEHADEIEVLLLGNSHGLFGLRPEAFPKKTYNLCNVSQIFEYDEFLLRRFLPKCSHLTDVFLIVDNSNLFDPPKNCCAVVTIVTVWGGMLVTPLQHGTCQTCHRLLFKRL